MSGRRLKGQLLPNSGQGQSPEDMGRDFHLKSAHASLVSPASVFCQATFPRQWHTPGHSPVAAGYPGCKDQAIVKSQLSKFCPSESGVGDLSGRIPSGQIQGKGPRGGVPEEELRVKAKVSHKGLEKKVGS